MKRNSLVLAGLFLSYVSILLYHTRSFLTITELAGRDLVGAYSLVKVFEFGWNTDWFLGFPLFHFYPPGFFFTTDLLGYFTGDLIAFKALVYLSLILFPLGVYYFFSTVFNFRTGLIGFILGFSVVFLRDEFSLIYQTLQVGLVAEMFAIVLLLPFMSLLWKNSRGSAYLSGFLMAIILLSHPYVAAVATLYLLIYFFLEKNLFRVLMASTGYLLTAWWWIPIIEKSWYMQNYVGPTGQLANWPWLFIPFIFVNRSRRALSVSILGLTLLIIGTFQSVVEYQFYRFFLYGQLITVFAAAPGLWRAFELLSSKINPDILILLLFISFLVPVMATDISEDWKSSVEIDSVVPEDGRMIVETSHGDIHNSYVPIQKAPLISNVTVVNGLYADSSISSPYLLGLEKAFAEDPIPNPLAVEANLTSEQLENRFEYFGINYALVRTDHAREKLSFMEKLDENEEFKLLYSEPVRSNQSEKIFVNGEKSKWKKLNEHIFRKELRTDIIYSYGKDGIKLTETNSANPNLLNNSATPTSNLYEESIEESIRPTNQNYERLFHLEK